MSDLDATSVSLLQAVRQLDQAACRRMVDLYSPLLHTWCQRAGVQAEDAADIVQDVFSNVFRKIGSFRREKAGDTFRGWLRVILRHKLADHFRQRREEARAQGGSTAHAQLQELPDPYSLIGDSEFLVNESAEQQQKEVEQVMRRALELIQTEFAQNTWKAFLGMVVENRRQADVAADLGISVGAVRQAKYKVLKRLRSEFSGLIF